MKAETKKKKDEFTCGIFHRLNSYLYQILYNNKFFLFPLNNINIFKLKYLMVFMELDTILA